MVIEKDERDAMVPWDELAGVVNGLSPEDRDRFRMIFRIFAHDLRQACGQIQSAERLLRRRPVEEGAEEFLELLGVIQAANTAANSLLDSLTFDFIENIETDSN